MTNLPNFFGFILSFIGGLLLLIGNHVEPLIGVWIISLGGTLLTASLGEDKTFKGILFYLIVGLGWGIFGSQIIHALWEVLPQEAVCFFTSMFGGEMTWYILRSMKQGSIGDFFIELIAKLIPFAGITKKKN